jgi:hypothetical protein
MSRAGRPRPSAAPASRPDEDVQNDVAHQEEQRDEDQFHGVIDLPPDLR